MAVGKHMSNTADKTKWASKRQFAAHFGIGVRTVTDWMRRRLSGARAGSHGGPLSRRLRGITTASLLVWTITIQIPIICLPIVSSRRRCQCPAFTSPPPMFQAVAHLSGRGPSARRYWPSGSNSSPPAAGAGGGPMWWPVFTALASSCSTVRTLIAPRHWRDSRPAGGAKRGTGW